MRGCNLASDALYKRHDLHGLHTGFAPMHDATNQIIWYDRQEGGRVLIDYRGGDMALTSRMRDLRRRQRRVKKLRTLKAKLRETNELKARQKLIERIRRVSPGAEIPE